MNNSIRIRTDVGINKRLNFQLNQDFDFLEILSLKLRQEDLYKLFCSDYGVIVGRVLANDGLGIPNAKVSIFIPISESDKNDGVKSGLYPYEYINDKNSENIRYNLLPNEKQFDCHTPVGTMPSKRQVLDNDELLEIYQNYYKFSTRTNESGDFMIFGVPTGTWKLNVDVDLSDIGIFSQKPYDFIRQGKNEKLFESPSKFKSDNNLNNLQQIFHVETVVDVASFWGDSDNFNVGINRIDVDLPHKIEPQAFFIGSIFGDRFKNNVRQKCGIDNNMGDLKDCITSEGTIEMIRKTTSGEIEEFLVQGGRLIDSDGTWAFQIPMNLDRVVTDEFGNLIPTDDPNKGAGTKASVRFRVGMDITGAEGRLARRAKFLIPNNPTEGHGNYDFNENTPDTEFRNLYWNKIYTVKSFIPRLQRNIPIETDIFKNRNFIGIKDVDGDLNKNPFPFNHADASINLILEFFCVFNTLIASLVRIINRFVLSPLNAIIIAFRDIQFGIAKLACTAKHLLGVNAAGRRGACRCKKFRDIYGDCLPPSPGGVTTPEQNCNECAELYGDDEDEDGCEGSECDDCANRCTHTPSFQSLPIPYITLDCAEATYLPWFTLFEITPLFGGDSCDDINHEPSREWCISAGITSTNVSDYLVCKANEFIEKNTVVRFDFYNDWINGTLYSFLFKVKVKKDTELRFCDYNCAGIPPVTDNNSNGVADNNCNTSYLVDICCDTTNNTLGSGDEIRNFPIRHGFIKYYEDEFYYVASSNGFPMFKTDLVLLGSINNCDINGIPLIYNYIPSTTYNRPPNTRLDDITSIDELLYSFNPNGCSPTISTRNCSNLRKICELGVGDDSNTPPGITGVINSSDIDNQFTRDEFAILNITSINNDIDDISQQYFNTINTFNAIFGDNWPSGSDSTPEYRIFRGFNGAGGSTPNLPFKNSFYFYFGLKPGATALDKFFSNFVGDCNN